MQSFGVIGCNQAVMCADMGVKTGLVTCIGYDEFGTRTLRHIREFNVDISLCMRSESSTGIAYILVGSESGANQIVVIPGANMKLLPPLSESVKASIASSRVI